MVLCWVLAGTLVVINVAAYFLVRHDKKAAQAQRRSNPPDRIPERVFQLVAAIGGWPGEVLAMRQVRHKTRKRGFQVVLFLAAVLGTAAWLGWFIVFDCLAPSTLGL